MAQFLSNEFFLDAPQIFEKERLHQIARSYICDINDSFILISFVLMKIPASFLARGCYFLSNMDLSPYYCIPLEKHRYISPIDLRLVYSLS